MANSKTQYLEAAFLNKVLKDVDFTVPGVFIGLKVGGVEVAGNGYARQQITAANWSNPADDGAGGMESHNTIDIFFPQASGGAWGLVDGFLLADALTGGNRLYEDALAVSKQIDDLDQFKINAGDLVVHER
ncbi:MAG TPA: hypothetical protein VN428_08985 [Bryobacteraceae bacterium]|nr:hypothetical protein [Bryobacteraceae bacterium]